VTGTPGPSAPAFLAKIVERAQAPAAMRSMAAPVVFTNGVFDVLHRGHVTYLAQARELGGSLVVAINTDASARRLGKGPERPLNGEHDRAAMLAALASVDLVTWFDEDTPVALLAELRPHIYVKGGDYDVATLEETRVIQGWGGRALSIPFLDGYSTTALVRRIRG
jgi:rfaE bifunctional protein nucleotidyltransferase chain/domain